MRLHPLCVLLHEGVDRACEFGVGLLDVVGLEDACLRLDHLGERPEADALAVGKRAALAPEDELGVLLAAFDRGHQLTDEAALPDAGDADERDELGRFLKSRARERALQQLELAFAADELGGALLSEVDAETGARLYDLPDGDRLLLSLRLDRRGLAVVDRLRGGPVGRLADEDPVHRRGGLDAGGGVDDVACGHAFPRLGPRREVDQRLAGVDADPDLELPLLGNPVTDRERRAQRTFRIVFVRNRRAEERHHRVTDELLDGSAVAFELGPQARVVGHEHRPHVLRVEPLGARGEPDQIGEEDGDDLPLGSRGRSGSHKRRSALGAEFRPDGVVVAARRARAHP